MVETSSAKRMVLKQLPCPLIQCDAWDGALAAFEAALAREIGGALPTQVGEIAGRDGLKVVRAGPRRFWIFPRERSSTIASGIPPELGCRLDLSEGRIRIEVSTPDLCDVVSKCLAIDWDRTLGLATFSSLHRIPVMFTRSSERDGEFVVPRSFARSISEWLEECQ
ncbi:sarcosine oxidase subunit gamma [Sinorhizobium garamanticum]|uniref:Sarcosine oxidase subunit gamma n=1 Tax=Sinorhizobium garamanticum TaxID=680247 RepID=A0ABY8DLJ7_9HYPH|nr:sarcosine oxidase subunit gamma [Sinorhizobium garamanticum]WEX91147.1 sarcosine oxidase subunit gamma [Sinorhizobium garamanticum]